MQSYLAYTGFTLTHVNSSQLYLYSLFFICMVRRLAQVASGPVTTEVHVRVRDGSRVQRTRAWLRPSRVHHGATRRRHDGAVLSHGQRQRCHAPIFTQRQPLRRKRFCGYWPHDWRPHFGVLCATFLCVETYHQEHRQLRNDNQEHINFRTFKTVCTKFDNLRSIENPRFYLLYSMGSLNFSFFSSLLYCLGAILDLKTAKFSASFQFRLCPLHEPTRELFSPQLLQRLTLSPRRARAVIAHL